ncbi:MAG: M1 family metallopeptidase [Bacteroidales bacterium]
MTKEIRKAYDNQSRSWDGNPGPKYWQNSASYTINARFDPDSVKITGKEIIEYQNNSPDTLNFIRFMLKQNMYKKGAMRDFPVLEQNLTDGVSIHSVVFENDTIHLDNQEKLRFFATGMQLHIDSSQFILPHSTTKIEVEWSLEIPYQFEHRFGRSNDSAFFIGYWFPQIVVYDDLIGWDNAFFTGIQETYNDVSHFDVYLEIPVEYLVWATGDLQNPEEIYHTEFIAKVEESKQADEIVQLISKEDLKKNNVIQKNMSHIWHFKAEKVTDFAFAVSNNSIWDATSVVTDTINNSRTWVNVVYHPDTNEYKTVAETAKQSIHYFSTEFPGIPFPFQKQTTFFTQRNPGGMEFPMMAANGLPSDSVIMVDLTAHEIAHSYFPFFILTNEEKYAWMDEGWVTYISHSFLKSLGLSIPSGGELIWNSENDIPLHTPSSYMNVRGVGFNYYAKSSAAFAYLFDILEEQGIPNPLKKFMERWKYKHPISYDYFFTMEELLGEDLSWYWNPWYFEFSATDLRIENVKQDKDNIEVLISNPGKLPLPVALKAEFENGEILEDYKSAYIWKGNPETISLNYKSAGKIKQVSLGDNDIDVNKADNVWKNGE